MNLYHWLGALPPKPPKPQTCSNVHRSDGDQLIGQFMTDTAVNAVVGFMQGTNRAPALIRVDGDGPRNEFSRMGPKILPVSWLLRPKYNQKRLSE